MNKERWQQVERIYHEALELAPDERPAFLDAACAADDKLRREIESLLRYDARAENFIEENPALAVAAMMLNSEELNSRLPRLGIGSQLGAYRLLEPLGKGGMGEVWLTEDTRLRRRVALKLLPASLAADKDAGRRFLREARAAAALDHPNICAIHEIGEDGGRSFIVMQYIEGETLSDKLRRERLSVDVSLALALQIADALTEAHGRQIIHRDIKPANIIVTPRGQAKVLDFGLARFVEAESDTDDETETSSLLSTPGQVMGTVPYMSPEQVRGEMLDARTDIFSFGVLLYEMLSGQQPFLRDSQAETISAILTHEPPVSELTGEHAEALQAIVCKCLAKERESRYQTANQLLIDLQKLSQREEKTSRAESTARKKWKLAALALGGLAVAAALIWFVGQRSREVEKIEISRTAQLTFWKGLDFYPALAPDGKTIAFSSDRSGSFEIWVKQLVDGAREVQITADGGQNFQPAFSPDGSLIAYHSKKRGGIWVVPATGGTARRLTEFGAHPAWSPGAGAQLAFQSETFQMIGYRTLNVARTSTLWAVPSQGGEPRQLTHAGAPPGGHGAPAWSPDGKRLVFDSNGVVWSVSARGDDLKKLSAPVKGALGAVYAPDGQSVYFTADDGWSLYHVSLSAAGDPLGEPALVSSGSGPHINKLSFAANGKSLVYAALTTMSNIWGLPLAPKTYAVSGKPVQLTQNANTCDVAPVYSPDGKSIAYFTFATGAPRQLWTMGVDGNNQTQIPAASGSHPGWFPDGKRLAFRPENHDGLWAVSLEGGKGQKFFAFDADTDEAILAPDGQRVAFISRRGGAPNLWVAPLAGGAPKQLTFEQEAVFHPAWSRDGKWLAFELKRGRDGHVAIISSEGGAPVQLTAVPGLSLVSDWSPDGQRVLFAGQRDGVWNVWSVERSTKQQKQITNYTTFNSYVRGPAWSPRGDQIVYEYAENTGNIWMLELK